jgi:hypothetical protein
MQSITYGDKSFGSIAMQSIASRSIVPIILMIELLFYFKDYDHEVIDP